jgi:hypothetical protein
MTLRARREFQLSSSERELSRRERSGVPIPER